MRTLSKDEKSFLDKIARYDNSTLNPVSDIISEIFIPGQTALLIKDKAYLLKRDNVERDAVISRMLCLISLLSELKQEGYIYLLEKSDSGPLLIQKDQRNEVWSAQGRTCSVLGNFEFIGSDTVRVSDGKSSYAGKAFSQELSLILDRLLTSYLCSTDKLKSFKKVGYVTDDVKRYKTELCYTRIGLVISLVALFVSLLFPLWLTKWQTSYQTDYNNKNAITTIDETQLNKVVSNLKQITTSLDSINTNINTIHKLK